MGWIFKPLPEEKYLQVIKDISKDITLIKIQNKYGLWMLIGLLLPAIIGGIIAQNWYGFLSGFLWGGIIRLCAWHHVTWSVNSLCHLIGKKLFQSKDNSKNNFIVAILSLGEGWHNNHHAFPYSSRHGLKFWQIDFSYIVIKFMEKLGLAWELKLPTKAAIQNKLIKK